MSTSTRITRSKGESDGLSLPMRTRPIRRDTASGRNRGTVLGATTTDANPDAPLNSVTRSYFRRENNYSTDATSRSTQTSDTLHASPRIAYF